MERSPMARETGSSIPGWVVLKTQKMVLDTALLNTQHYKVRIKDKVEQSREWSSALSYTSLWYLLKRELQVTLNYGCQLYLHAYIYIYIHTHVNIYIYVHIIYIYIYIYIPYIHTVGKKYLYILKFSFLIFQT